MSELLTPEEIHQVMKDFAIEVWGYLPEYAEGLASGGMTNNKLLSERVAKAQLAKLLKHRSRPELREELAKIYQSAKIVLTDGKYEVFLEPARWDILTEEAKEHYRKQADQLLLLYPDEKEG